MSLIKALPGNSVHKITSGQVVIDLQTAVKELVENSLDAGATLIEVRFKDHGLKSIEVVDNGTGIKPADYEAIGLKHHTSKLAEYSDLSSVTSFGFRGEAISSLCALSESVTIATATEGEAPMGTVLELDRSGHLKSSAAKIARQRGTTVTVTNLFAPLPVRRAELTRHVKREHSKAVALLTAYAMVPCSRRTGVRMIVSNQPEGGKKSVQIRTDGTPNLKGNITSLWGRKALEGSMDISLDLIVEPEKGGLKRAGLSSSSTTLHVEGIIGSPSGTSSRSSPDRQYLYLNSRPCSLPKVQKAISEVWHNFYVNGHGFWVLDLRLPTDAYDINVSPDKRSVLLHNEENVVAAVKTALEDLWAPTRSTFTVNGPGPSRSQGKPHADTGPQRRGSDAANGDPDESDSEEEEEEEAVLYDLEAEPSMLATTQPAKPSPVVGSTKGSSRRPFGEPDTTTRRRPAKTLSPIVLSSESFTDADGAVQSPSPLAVQEHTSSTSAPLVVQTSKPQTSSSDPRPSTPSTRENPALIDENHERATLEHRAPRTPARTTLSTLTAAWSRSRSSPYNEPPAKRRRISSPLKGQVSEGRSPHDTQSSVRSGHGDPVTTCLSGKAMSVETNDIPSGDLSDDKDVVMLDAPESDSVKMEEKESILEECDVEPSRNVDAFSQARVIDLTTDEPAEDEQSRVPRGSLGDKAVTTPPDRNVRSRAKAASQDASSISNSKVVEVLRQGPPPERSVTINMSRIRSSWSRLRTESIPTPDEERTLASDSPVVAAGIDKGNADAERILSRVISKADFENMEVLGQFNLGFIIVRLRRNDADGTNKFDELFIVDQHAADEKYNFETLQQTTRIQSQALLQPRPLELTPSDELVALENLDILRNNGFEINVSKEEGNDSPEERRPRMNLTAQPVSKETVFDMKDLEELLHLMQDTAKGQMVRCSKARSMFAMRACRKSVMVGKALTTKQMVSVVRHMGTMDQPWNCPHGRPTMRHLLSIPDYLKRLPPKPPVDWSDFE